MEFNIEKFNPIKKELYELAKTCKKVILSDNKTGYEAIKANRIVLKKRRCEVVKILTDERAISNSYSTACISLQKELVAIIEPLEKQLEDKQKAVDLEIFIEKQKELLPERKERLEKIDVTLSDREILVMKDNDFETFFNSKNAEYLEEKERKLEEEKQRLAEEKRVEEAKRRAEKEAQEKAIRDAKIAKTKAEKDKTDAIEAEKEKVRKAKKSARIKRITNLGLVYNGAEFIKDDINIHHTELLLDDEKFEIIINKISKEIERRNVETAKRRAGEEKQRAIEAEKQKADKEKAQIIADQQAKEKARIEAEEAKVLKEKQEKESIENDRIALEKKKKYQKFLADNGYDDTDNFHIFRFKNKISLYKKIGELTI